MIGLAEEAAAADLENMINERKGGAPGPGGGASGPGGGSSTGGPGGGGSTGGSGGQHYVGFAGETGTGNASELGGQMPPFKGVVTFWL